MQLQPINTKRKSTTRQINWEQKRLLSHPEEHRGVINASMFTTGCCRASGWVAALDRWSTWRWRWCTNWASLRWWTSRRSGTWWTTPADAGTTLRRPWPRRPWCICTKTAVLCMCGSLRLTWAQRVRRRHLQWNLRPTHLLQPPETQIKTIHLLADRFNPVFNWKQNLFTE